MVEKIPKFSVLIANHNNKSYLPLVLSSLRKYSAVDHEVIIVDDGSEDGSDSWLRNNRIKYDFTYFRYDVRQGIVGAYEKLVELATTDICFFVHSDMILSPDWDTNLYKHLKEKTVVSATRIEPPLYAPAVYKHHVNCGWNALDFNMDLFLKAAEELKRDLAVEGVFIPYLFFKKDWIGYDPVFAPSTREDSDLFLRWKQAGVRFVNARDSMVYHFSGRGGRHLNDDLQNNNKQWQKQERKNLKNFVRKYGTTPLNTEWMNPILVEKTPLSAVVLLRNEGDLVYEFLDSVEAYFDEIVFVNDNSTDNSLLEIERYKTDIQELQPTNFNPEKIKVFNHSLNKDFAQARNFGTAQCQNEWVFHLDVDEKVSAGFFEHLQRILQQLRTDQLPVQCMGLSRVNTIDGVIVNDIPRDEWYTVETQALAGKQDGRIQNPDWQFRLHKNDVVWGGMVHEVPTIVSQERIGREVLFIPDIYLVHQKSSVRQKRQNSFYDDIQKQSGRTINKVVMDSVLWSLEGITHHAREEMKELHRRGLHVMALDHYRFNPKIKDCASFKEWAYNPIDIQNDDYVTICNQPPIRWQNSLGLKNFYGYLAFEGLLPKQWVDIINHPNVKGVMVPSSMCKEDFIKSGVKKPVHVVPHGVDETVWNDSPVEKFPVFTYLAVGTTHNERKGFAQLIKGWCDAFGDRQDVRLLFKLNPIYDRRVNHNNYLRKHMTTGNENIAFVDDDLSEEEMAELFKKSHVFVSTSLCEGFNIGALQALAVGLPVIVPDFGGQMDFCTKERCLIVPTKSYPVHSPFLHPYENARWKVVKHQELVDVLKLSRTEYEGLSKAALKESVNVRKEYSWSKVVDKMLEVVGSRI